MVKVTFVEHNGKESVVEADTGLSVMEVAVKNGVNGIDADCGGACACATCHCYLEGDMVSKIDAPDPMEESMLDFAQERQDNSRLSCQVKVTSALEGLVVKLPEFQG